MRVEFLKTPVSWAGVASLVGSCYEDGKSFIPVSDVRRFELADWLGKLHRASPVSSFLLLVLSIFLSFLQIARTSRLTHLFDFVMRLAQVQES